MKSSRFEPNIFALWTVPTTGLSELPGGDHPPSVFLKTRRNDPPQNVFEFDLTRESKSIEALLMSPISASDFIATLSGSAVPLGSTDVAVPETPG